MPKAIPLKETKLSDLLASIKAKVEARAKLTPEQRAEQDKATALILKELGPDGPTVLIVGK